MKHELQALMRFDTAEERDAEADRLKPMLKAKYRGDDAHILYVDCFHDEAENRPCKVTKKLNAGEFVADKGL